MSYSSIAVSQSKLLSSLGQGADYDFQGARSGIWLQQLFGSAVKLAPNPTWAEDDPQSKETNMPHTRHHM
jgi:hypothetical protein